MTKKTKNKQKIDTFSSISFELYIRKEKWIAFLESTDHFLSKEIQIYIVWLSICYFYPKNQPKSLKLWNPLKNSINPKIRVVAMIFPSLHGLRITKNLSRKLYQKNPTGPLICDISLYTIKRVLKVVKKSFAILMKSFPLSHSTISTTFVYKYSIACL